MDDATALTLLERFSNAWNGHDVGALLSCMTEDGVFHAAAGGSSDGTEHRGRESLRSAFDEVFTTFPDARWNDARHFVSGDRAVTEWTFTGTRADGNLVRVRGCDVFLLRDGRIAVKDTFRKMIL